MKIADMRLKEGTKKALWRARYMADGPVLETSEDLEALTDDELLTIRNIGKTRLHEIREELAEIRYSPRNLAHEAWIAGA